MFQFLLIFSFKARVTDLPGEEEVGQVHSSTSSTGCTQRSKEWMVGTCYCGLVIFPPGLQTLLRVCENERCKEQLYIHYSAKSKYVCVWWDLLGVSAGQPVHPVLPFCVILQVLVCNICKGIYTFLANTTINSRWRHCFWVLFGVVGRNQISSMTFSWVVENIRSKVVRIYFTEDSY